MSPSIDECLASLRKQFDVIAEIRCDYHSIATATVDLYARLHKIWQDRFENDQRIALILEHDFYDKDSQAGALLQTIQIIVQDIDISNFFVCVVSTNPDLQTEYTYINQNFSSDPVPFHCYLCSGNFQMLDKSTNKTIDGKKQSLKNIVEVIDNLSRHHGELLFVDPVFCMMPWVGLAVAPDNLVRPCCEYTGKAIGNTAQQTIAEIWNAAPMREIRRSMLHQQPLQGCQGCYHKEQLQRDSLRNSINRDFAHRVNLINDTDKHGEVSAPSIRYWDIRYNNLCNFACRSCGPGASSSWYQIHNDLYPDRKRDFALLQAGLDNDKIFDEISKNIDCVEKIYFAGGEPLIIENFYRVLELLDAHGRHDVQLCYNTNLSRLTLKHRSVLDLWKRFHKVSVGASLDAMGDRAAYLRTGTVWKDIVTNRKKILEHCPHIDFYVSATTGLINALHVADFHSAWVDQGLIAADDFNIQLLYEPAYMSVKNAPEKLRAKIISRYNEHIEWLRSRDRTGRAISGFRSVIAWCQEPGQYDRHVFWREIGKLDQYHATDLLETFCELTDCDL